MQATSTPSRRFSVPTVLRLLAAVAFVAGPATMVALAAEAQPSASDLEWTALGALRRNASESKVTKTRGLVAANAAEAARLKGEREIRAQRFRATAQSAREFHTRNPSHPKAEEARKLEALASLEGITPKDAAYERTALAVAGRYRADKSRPVADRIQVAHAMESLAIVRKVPGRPWFANPVLAETMLDRLHREFGEQPAIWANYLSLAENTYCDAGRDVAHRIAQSLYAPESTRTAARRILQRYALVRRPLDFPLTPTQGAPTTLAKLAGNATVVCFWDGTRHPEGPPGLYDFRKNPSPNTRWVYVSIGSLGSLPTGKKPSAAPPGTTCVEPLGWQSPVVTKLLLPRLPYAIVLDEKKQLSGYGRIDEIPDLLAGIGRPILP